MKIHVNTIGEELMIRFTYHDGLRDWAQDELKARFEVESSDSWAYYVPATINSAARLARTAPVEVEGDADFIELVTAAGSLDRYDYKTVFSGMDLQQPEIRRGDMWEHQLMGFHFIKTIRKGVAMLGMGMGTGKSKTLIDYGINEHCRSWLLVVPPNVFGTWRKQFRLFAPQANVLLLDDSYASVARKRKAAEDFYKVSRRESNKIPFVVVINYESARMQDFHGWATRVNWDLCGLDEAHRAKDADGVTGKMINKLRFVSTRRICLTGTPMPHSPADLFSQFRFLSPAYFGDSFFRYKKRYSIEGFFGENVGWRRKDELRKIFHTGAIIIGSEVLKLPDVLHTEREFVLDKKTLAVYRELWSEMIAEVKGGVCTVDNALVKLIRAQQITSGFLPLDIETGDEDGDIKSKMEILNHAKEEALRELLADAPDDAPIVVFCRWRYDLDRIKEVVESLEWERNGCKAGNEKKRAQMMEAGTWRPYKYGEISGRPGRKKDLTADSTLPPGFNVFGVQVQSGGVGVDFTAACIAILYSIDFSLGNYDQMLARLHRPGQTKPVRFYHLIARKTVDRRIYDALQARREVVQSIMSQVAAGNEDLEDEGD